MPPVLPAGRGPVAILIAGTLVGLLSPVVRAEPPPPSDVRPPAFVRAWQNAVSATGSTREDAIRMLAATKEWEPFFRSAYNPTTDQSIRDSLRPVLIKCQADLFARNLEPPAIPLRFCRSAAWKRGKATSCI